MPTCLIGRISHTLGKLFEACPVCFLIEYLGGRLVDTSALTKHLLLIVWIIKRREEFTTKFHLVI